VTRWQWFLPAKRRFADLKVVPAEAYIFVVLMGLTLGVRWAVGWNPFDDAFITFRYARNMVAGWGLVYNVGEHVLGITTPFYALLLAGLHWVSRLGFEQLAWSVNLAAELLNVFLLWSLSADYGFRPLTRFAIGSAYATSVFTVAIANSGMESPLFILALLLSLKSLERQSWKWLGICLGWATLIRPEGLIATTLIIGLVLLKQRSSLHSMIVPWCFVILPWVLIATWYYGSPIPNTVIAKQAAFEGQRSLSLVYLLLASRYSVWTYEINGTFEAFVLLIMLVFALLITVGAWRTFKVKWTMWFIPLFWIAYALFLVASPVVEEWYVVVLVPFSLLLIGVAIEYKYRFRGGGLILLVLAGWQLSLWGTGSASSVFSYHHERYTVFTEAAQKVIVYGGQSAFVAAPEIGRLGYELPTAHILDTVGLVSPQAIPFHKRLFDQHLADVGIPYGLILEAQPDFIVSLDIFVRTSHLSDAAFLTTYEKVDDVPTHVFNSQALQIFKRRK
jgi:hypothetical protein